MYQVYQENQPYIEVPTCIYLGLGNRVSSIPGEPTLYRGSHLYISRTIIYLGLRVVYHVSSKPGEPTLYI